MVVKNAILLLLPIAFDELLSSHCFPFSHINVIMDMLGMAC